MTIKITKKIKGYSVQKPEDKAEREQEKRPANTADSQPEKQSAGRPETEPEKRSGNGSDGAKPAGRPEGRLLPWEPTQLPAEIKKDKPAEPRREADADERAESSSGDGG